MILEKMNAMSLKAKIRNIAKEKGVSAQVVLQSYFFERFLDRLSRSEYRDEFILKGGFLIAAMAGLDARSTMDMDTTVRSFPLDEEHIRTVMDAISKITVDDGIVFKFAGSPSFVKMMNMAASEFLWTRFMKILMSRYL
jgi:hypothetical protein